MVTCPKCSQTILALDWDDHKRRCKGKRSDGLKPEQLARIETLLRDACFASVEEALIFVLDANDKLRQRIAGMEALSAIP